MHTPHTLPFCLFLAQNPQMLHCVYLYIYDLVYVILERDPKRLHSLTLLYSLLWVLPLACLLRTFTVVLSVSCFAFSALIRPVENLSAVLKEAENLGDQADEAFQEEES